MLNNYNNELIPVEKSKESLVDRYQNFAAEHPVIATITETVGAWALDTAVFIAKDNQTDHLGHLMSERDQNPLKFDVLCSTLVPVTEELRFRSSSWFVALIAPDAKMLHASVDIISAFRFAEIHRGDNDSFPIPEFIGGLHCARLRVIVALGMQFLHTLSTTPVLQYLKELQFVSCRVLCRCNACISARVMFEFFAWYYTNQTTCNTRQE